MPVARSRPGLMNAARRRVATSVADPGLGERDGAARHGAERNHVRAAGRAGREPEEALDLGAAIEPLALDPLAVAPEHAAAHVGVERRWLDAEHARRLLDRQVLLAVHADHGISRVSGSDASRHGRSRPPRPMDRSILIKYNQYKSILVEEAAMET